MKVAISPSSLLFVHCFVQLIYLTYSFLATVCGSSVLFFLLSTVVQYIYSVQLMAVSMSSSQNIQLYYSQKAKYEVLFEHLYLV